MGFKEDLQQLSVQIAERKNYVKNEETTKQALIIPFIQLLSYDVFNPLEVRPEYISDFAKKKGEKVDYAIFNNDEAIIFIEAKSITENLEKHSAQLARYFNATPELKLAILTNGIEYHFFTDLNVVNVMDENPFFRFNIVNLSADSFKVLEFICKQNFNTKTIIELAEELVYAKDLDIFLTRILKEPPNEFIRFILKNISHNTRITAALIDKFRPIVKKSISNAIKNIVVTDTPIVENLKPDNIKKNKNQINKSNKPKNLVNNDLVTLSSTSKETFNTEVSTDLKTQDTDDQSNMADSTPPIEPANINKLLPSENDIWSFECIKKILQLEDFEIINLNYINTSSYFSIYNEKLENWIVNVNFNEQAKYIIVPFTQKDVAKRIGNIFSFEQLENQFETKIFINEPKDLYKLARLFIKRFVQLTKS